VIKVNRCLTEGRQALAVRLAGIEGGIECAKLAPQLSALADGEASADEVAALRPHLKTCLSCRARLRLFREAPARVAALVPPAALLAADPGAGPLRGLVESIVDAAQHKAAVLGERAHAAAELATAQKVAAVAASAAALAGGGTAVDRFANHQGPPQPRPVEQVEAEPVKEEQAPVQSAPPAEPVADQQPAEAHPAPTSALAPEPPPPPPDPANEFAPAGSDPATAAPPASRQPGPAASPQPGSAPAPPAGGGGGSREFAL
jgi:hypothetical protein